MTSLFAIKSEPKVFVNDLNVNRFFGIFSAHYCWPQDYEEGRRAKSWTQIMFESFDWFEAKLWPKITTNMPIITANERTVHQITELMVGLILKELDVMTVSQMRYFESIVDIFNDEITIGVIFWLKICFEYNWRLIYAKQVVGHRNKHLRQTIQLIYNEIEANANQKCLTPEEISYFYSVVDCICVQLLANNIGKQSTEENEFLAEMRTKCLSKMSELKFDPLFTQLSTFNALTQELTHFVLNVNQSDCLCVETIDKQIQAMEGLFTSVCQELDINREIPSDDPYIKEDVSDSKDNYKSLKLVSKQYSSITNSNLKLTSLQKFFDLIDSKTEALKPSKRYSYLSNILRDKENPNLKTLIEILINFADFETFHTLLLSIDAQDINRFDFGLRVAKRVTQLTRDKQTKTLLTTVLRKSLKISTNIDLKSRLNELKINKTSEPDTDLIKTLFNQITKDDMNGNLFQDLAHELLIAIYQDPFRVYNLVLDLALHHNRAHTALVAKLICNNLYDLSVFRMNSSEKETFVMKYILYVLTDKPSIQLVEDVTKLIGQIVNCPMAEGLEPVLTLEGMFFYFVTKPDFMREDIVWLKLNLMNNLIELSGDQKWNAIQREPVPILAFILQILDYYWLNPSRKQLVIDVLDAILEKKLTRNLTEEELTDFEQLLREKFRYTTDGTTVGKATTYKIFLAFCEKRFPKPIGEVIDITKHIFHDQILLYATITPDFEWICRIYVAYEAFTEQTQIALKYILPALTTQQFYKLFKFLRMYYYNSSVVSYLKTAIFKCPTNVDTKPYINALMDIMVNEVLPVMNYEEMERPLNWVDDDYIERDLVLIFLSMVSFEYLLIPEDMSRRLYDILLVVAQKMWFQSINPFSKRLYEDVYKMPVIARKVFEKVYGEYYTPSRPEVSTPEPVTGLLPAGCQPQKRSYIEVIPLEVSPYESEISSQS